jgi:hypothetical protein
LLDRSDVVRDAHHSANVVRWRVCNRDPVSQGERAVVLDGWDGLGALIVENATAVSECLADEFARVLEYALGVDVVDKLRRAFDQAGRGGKSGRSGRGQLLGCSGGVQGALGGTGGGARHQKIPLCPLGRYA